jgi:hypothetical protein
MGAESPQWHQQSINSSIASGEVKVGVVGKQEIPSQLAALAAAERMMSHGWVDSAKPIAFG